jgi:LacI family transcriptional regulator
MTPTRANRPQARPIVLIKYANRAAYLDLITRGILAHPNCKLRWEVINSVGDAPIAEILHRHAEADALITHVNHGCEIDALRAWKKPAVLVEQDPALDLPVVRADNLAVGKMAAEYFLRRGYTHFGYIGPCYGTDYSIKRERGFFDAALEAGARIHPVGDSPYPHEPKLAGPWHDLRNGLGLNEYPQPLAMLVDNSYHAQSVALGSRHAGIAVPEQIAIMGVDNDEVLCEGCVPPISAIDQGTFQIGYQAAELIDAMLRGQAPEEKQILVPPAGVIERQSTNTFAIDDPYIQRALAFIREKAVDAIGTAEVLQAVPVSRRYLEIRFKEKLGRTIHQEITRVRMEHVKELLRTTSMPLAEIAERTGFSYPTKMSHAFKREVGTTPSDYRKTHREI